MSNTGYVNDSNYAIEYFRWEDVSGIGLKTHAIIVNKSYSACGM